VEPFSESFGDLTMVLNTWSMLVTYFIDFYSSSWSMISFRVLVDPFVWTFYIFLVRAFSSRVFVA